MKKMLRPGFTLIELAIGILIIGICGLAVMGLFIEGASHVMRSEVVGIGKALIQQEMEDVLIDSFADIASRTTRTCPNPFNSYTVSVEVAYVSADLSTTTTYSEYKRIRVTLSHPLINPMRLETIVSDYNNED